MTYDYQTSYPAYKETGKDLCRSLVLVAIRKIQPCTDVMICEYLGWKINRVTPRRGELVTAGLVECARKGKDPVTKRLVNYWRVKNNSFKVIGVDKIERGVQGGLFENIMPA